MPTIYVGVDVSKLKFDACIKNQKNEFVKKPRSYIQNLDGFMRFTRDVDQARGNKDTEAIIGMESTGRYHINLMGYLINEGYNVREFNPIEVHGVRKLRMKRAKTDPIDSDVVATALMLDCLEKNERYLQDKDYTRMREVGLLHHGLSDKIGKLKVELREVMTVLCPGYGEIFTNILGKTSKAILRGNVKHTKLFCMTRSEIEAIVRVNYSNEVQVQEKVRKIIDAFRKTTVPSIYKESLIVKVKFILDQHDLLDKQMKMLEARIERHMKDIKPKSLSIPGVGKVTCAVVLGCIGNINRFKDKRALVAYAGLDPRVIQSGKSINRTGRISKAGNRYMRRYLLNAAHTGCRSNPVLSEMYNKLKSRGKPHMVALTACARKLLTIIYSVEKNQKCFYIPAHVSEQ